MKTLPNSQATFFDGMELPLMSSRAASHAKTLARQESAQEWVKEPAAGCGPKLSDLLASYDPATSSWRTSQLCLVARLNNVADGLAEFSETWPIAGIMQNGKSYRRRTWARPIAAKGSGLWLTPRKSDIGMGKKQETFLRRMGDRSDRCAQSLPAQVNNPKTWPTPSASDNRDRGNLSSPAIARRIAKGKQVMLSMSVSDQSGQLNPTWVEWLMGFPLGHTDLQPLETPLSPKSPK